MGPTAHIFQIISVLISLRLNADLWIGDVLLICIEHLV